MNSEKGNKKIEALLASVRKEFKAKEIIDALKEIREIAREETNPALVKICRLAYEYIDQNDNFDVELQDEEEEIEMPPMEYLLELMLHSDREINMLEIKEFKDVLTEELYG